ncbi:MutS-related protein [Chryseolinea lacunae]|uniref:DNA mismatch repair proteins mutS family domain-containing protein n=1 Tax=Chryseolinea lacunae TaxID=2801331 RepID=A0ABS1KVA4_9BACT|nr:MutS family DNA mismatch repair protein [Chryseolinea lacunae]MBL0742251.1 hypothetical protein [Chryseolinea lacunae]
MTLDECSAIYQNRIVEFSASLTQKKKTINIISNLRLVVAVLFLGAVYLTFSTTPFIYAAALLLVAFVILVQRHAKLFAEKVHLENLVTINQLEVRALKGDIAGFDAGLKFVDGSHAYSHDLDIFGDGSLFQAINRSNTLDGKNTMAQRLTSPLPSAEAITEHQEATKELAANINFRQHFQAAGKEIDEQPLDRQELLEWLQQPSILFDKSYFRLLLIALPALTLAAIAGAFFITSLKSVAVLLALTQWAFLGTYVKRVNAFHEYISRKKNILEKYAHLLHYLQQETFQTPVLKKLSAQAADAGVNVKALASLVSSLNARSNAMTTLVMNSLLMYDLQCVYRLEKWKHVHAAHLKVWLDAISETEVLCSVGTFAFNHPGFAYPIIDKPLSIVAVGMGHPLILENECVPNDITLGTEPSILIVTGANMAGKSTFLRTIGVNLVLALSGAPVCARSFRCPIITLRSGMRTADSLKDHQSYFYAELNRLKTIMDELRSDRPLFILLDEILKGTNSTDKQAGSIALVKQFVPHPCLAIIATHDLALGDLETEYPRQVKNFCFEATIENDQLSFDYKLKPGLAQKMNATFLMRKMGIIPKD